MIMHFSRVPLLLLLLTLGCTDKTHLIATPAISMGENGRAMFDRVPAELQSSDMTILYAADRAIVETTLLGPRYSDGRADHLVFGKAVVSIKPDASWSQLVQASTTRKRDRDYWLEIKSTAEHGQLAIALNRMEVREGRYRLPEKAMAELNAARDELRRVLAEQLANSEKKDVYIFVHGFNNTFDDAVFRLAQMWHMAGRVGVPMAYTWPAGRGGILGYAYDRESGEFTVFHLKKFLQAVAAVPEVQRIHLVAHSRGTDVACSALRELNIEYKSRGQSTQEQLKLENLVLAAPDLDADVFEQRFGLEDLHLAANRTTVYLSDTDIALAVSRWLFGSGKRLGTLSAKEIKPEARKKLTQLGRFDLIQCNVSGFSTSHDYAFAHPAVVSDIFLLLRDGKAPGAANGRPLRVPAEGVWEITNDYPQAPPP
jgi:esterase/lipase superfamily enzyme